MNPFRPALLLACALALGSLHAATPSTPLESLDATQIQQALDVLRQQQVSAGMLDETGMARATLSGVLEALQPGAALLAAAKAPAGASPFRSEVLSGGIGYVRPGSLQSENLALLDAALDDFTAKKVTGVVIDLRSTPESPDYALAAEFASRFVPAATPLFFLSSRDGQPAEEFAATGPTRFSGVLAIVADEETAGAAEALAAALRLKADAMLVGAKSSGRAVVFETVPLGTGPILELAVAEVRLEGGGRIYPDGLTPDLPVPQNRGEREEALAGELTHGVAPFVFEEQRAQLNEAALVAGTNPEIDTEAREEILLDRPLQRAVDLATAISLFRHKDQLPRNPRSN
ncbi:MAG: S41 family peptidase [Chthoniobacterales bacterium]